MEKSNYTAVVESFDLLMTYLFEFINNDKDYRSLNNNKPIEYTPGKEMTFRGININAIRNDLEIVANQREQFGMRLQDTLSTDHNERYGSYVSATYIEGAPEDSQKWVGVYGEKYQI